MHGSVRYLDRRAPRERRASPHDDNSYQTREMVGVFERDWNGWVEIEIPMACKQEMYQGGLPKGHGRKYIQYLCMLM